MIYQSEDLFLHDTIWKDDTISTFRQSIAQKMLPDECKNLSLNEAQFFYSFVDGHHFQNHYYLLTLFMAYSNLEYQLQQTMPEQPLIIFFDQPLNKHGQMHIKKLIWDALNYIHQPNSCVWPIKRLKGDEKSYDYYFYVNQVPLTIRYVDDQNMLLNGRKQTFLIVEKISFARYDQKHLMQKVS